MLTLHSGDFDGDTAWVCWEPQIVIAFENAPVPAKLRPESLGITTDDTRVQDIVNSPNYVSIVLKKGIESALQPKLLGMCTNYYESSCYHLEVESKGSSFRTSAIIELGYLLGHLVDSSKGGLQFTDSDWTNFKKHRGLFPFIPTPAYKDEGTRPPANPKHVIDKLMAEIRDMQMTSLKKFSDKHKRGYQYDHSLSGPAKAETDAASEPEVYRALRVLKAQIVEMKTFYIEKVQLCNSNTPAAIANKPGALSWNALMQELRGQFEKLAPSAEGEHPTLRRWRREHEEMPLSPASSWLRLKASLLYRECPKGNFHLYACGRELCDIKASTVEVEDKASAVGTEGVALVRRGIFEMMKVDAKMVRQAEAKRAAWEGGLWGAAADKDEDQEEFVDDMEDMMSSRGDD